MPSPADSSTPNEETTLSSTPTALPTLKELAGRNYATLPQVAKLIGKSYQVCLKMVRENPKDPEAPPRIKAVMVGGQWRVYEDEIRRLLELGNGRYR